MHRLDVGTCGLADLCVQVLFITRQVTLLCTLVLLK